MLKFASFVIVATALLQQLFASSPDSGKSSARVVKGNGYAFELSPPKGWSVDLEGGLSSGMVAQLFPENSAFATSPTVMFVSVLSKKTPGAESVEKLVKTNRDFAKKASSRVDVGRGDSYETKDHKKAVTTTYGGAQFQAISYIDEDSSIVMFVLRSNLKNRFDNAKYSLKDLIGSYRWAINKK